MSEYHAADNIYWVFSSSAQAVAAFIGFICAGFFFSHDRMDKKTDKDETLLEIYADLKKQHFQKLRTLLWLTGLSIILSLLVVFVNGFDTGPVLPIFAVLVALLNGVTILLAVLLVIDMVDPKNVEKTADKLIHESTGENAGGSAVKGTSKSQFFLKYQELEILVRKFLIDKNSSVHAYEKWSETMPLQVLIKRFHQKENLPANEYALLNKIIRMRNLISHSPNENVGVGVEKDLDRLIDFFRRG